ncbi:MAG: tail fiber domain-containing protein [Chitinivibrionales bacterium]|nr:tail fiber domain-containing protein [Chitinivibrionales bacterium]
MSKTLRLLSAALLVSSLASLAFAQSKSAIQFYDTLGTAKTGKVGWTGDATTGHFFVQTPNEGEVIKSQAGGVAINGTVNATKFVGDGSTLTNLPVQSVTVGSVGGLQDSLNKKAFSTEVAVLQGQVGAKADTTWVKTKIPAPSGVVTVASVGGLQDSLNKRATGSALATAQGQIATKVDSVWVTKNLTAVDSLNVHGTVIQKNGNVGIGTASPMLFGDNNTMLAITNGSTGNITFGSLATKGILAVNDGADVVVGSKTNSPLSIKTNNTTAMTLLPSGNVGIGTSSPQQKLQVDNGMLRIQAISNDTDIIQARSSAGSGFDFPVFELYHLGDWASGALTLNARVNNALSSSSRVHFNGRGPNAGTPCYILNNLGIGTTNPGSYMLEVCGDMATSGTALALNVACTSDRRYKTSITPIDSSLSKVSKLQGVYYDWDRAKWPKKNFPEGKQVGLIAQDVEKVIPEVVNTDKEGYKSLSYDKLTAVLIEAVKEQQKEISAFADENKSQKETIAKQQQSIANQESRIDKLQAMIDKLAQKR